VDLDDFHGKEIVIYGAGHVGRKFFRTLQAHGIGDQVCCFAVTKPVKEECAEGLPIRCIDEIPVHKETLVCLAVHEALREEMEYYISRITKQYVWIYPYLYNLMFGQPERVNENIEIPVILQNYGEDMRLAIRLAVIEQKFGKNLFGFEYYKKAQKIHCAEYTAGQRLGKFCRLIEDWEKEGYQKEHLLFLNQNYEMIDGNHRLSLAVYHKQKTIWCNIYPTKIPVEEIHGQGPKMSEGILIRHGFTQDDIQKLKKIQERYLSFYET